MVLPRDDDPREVDAFVEALLARHDGGPAVPGPAEAAALPRLADRGVQAAALELESRLVRFHPSFRFEEGLAARLRGAGRGEAAIPASGARVIAFPGMPASPGRGTVGAAADHGRGILVGGAIASGVSIAGAALLAWRRGRGARRDRMGMA